MTPATSEHPSQAPDTRAWRFARTLVVIFAPGGTGRATTAPTAVGAYVGAAYSLTRLGELCQCRITVGRIFYKTFAIPAS